MTTTASPNGKVRTRPHVGIGFHHPAAFWVGTAAIIAGVFMHFPDFMMAEGPDYMMAGMPMSGVMLAGMVLIILGITLAAFGLFPRRGAAGSESAGAGYHLKAMDDAELSPAHWGLLFVLGVALIVDVMKPATLGFVVPGSRAEYGLSIGQASLYPLFALTGTTVGSIVWGLLSDRLGRRASILLASLMFIGTGICGFMPLFWLNLLMCFLMGLAAGGMLPIVYALMAESVPAKKRGWLVVLHGGMGTVGGYLAASGAAALLVPHFGWRVLWFLNVPTGLLLLVLNRWIPESPRFLLQMGRVEDARNVMARYGVTIERDDEVEVLPAAVPTPAAASGHGAHGGSWRSLGGLFRHPYAGHTATVVLYGLGWGLVNWGFLTFLPTILDELGFEAGNASATLFQSALLAIPATVGVAYLYGRWSSKKTMILFAVATALTLLAFAVLQPGPGDEGTLRLLVIALLVFSSGVISMLSPYTAEVYPTHLRGTGSGLAAGSSKLGGILGPPVAAGMLAIAPGFVAPALAAAGPIALSAVLLAFKGVETIDRSLEDLTHDPLVTAGAGVGSVDQPKPTGPLFDPEDDLS